MRQGGKTTAFMKREKFFYDLPEGLRQRLFELYPVEIIKTFHSMFLEDISRRLQADISMYKRNLFHSWSINESQTQLLINEIELFLKEEE